METQQLKLEAQKLVMLLFALYTAIQIAFFKESPIIVGRLVLSLFFLFVIPGWCVLYLWREKIGFFERAVSGTLLFAGIFVLSAYYSGFVGIHIKYSTWIIPFIGYAAFIIQFFASSLHGKVRKH
ncbi:MAG: hypothetical protein AABX51_00160 [Nanoarchaeota archaeon]